MQRVNEHDLEYRNGDNGVKYLFRGPKIDWGVIRFKGGQTLGQHRHEQVEETFYFVKGEPLMKVNGEEFRVRQGDAFRMEPGDVHDIINDTGGDVDIVFIKDQFKPKDKIDVG
ncbi:MAG TPA: cupin domain-containing protein [Candidatus Brocadiia bacterium]|nr:cupin domain-containing protein [Candidatus Brocadiia bacterium]